MQKNNNINKVKVEIVEYEKAGTIVKVTTYLNNKKTGKLSMDHFQFIPDIINKRPDSTTYIYEQK